MQHVIPVLLAGGTGTRLWPLSRKSYPKQFANLIGDTSLFQQSALRLQASARVNFAPPMTLTNDDFRFIITEQLTSIGVNPGPILIEPDGRNTAPAILAASLYAARSEPDAVLLVAPSDHVIPDHDAFHKAVETGLEAALQGQIITFGITPTRAETGYGYLELERSDNNDAQPFDLKDLKQFIEKPNQSDAEAMLKDGRYLWNAGLFLFRAKDMIKAFEAHAPHFIPPVTAALDQGHSDLGFFRLEPEAWGACEDLSIDYAVMEHAPNLSAVTFSAGWSDLGGWDAVWQDSDRNEHGTAVSQNATSLSCKNTLLRSENESQHLVGLGLEDIVAIAMPDAVLVAHKDHAQDVKHVVSTLKAQNIRQADVFPKDHRPWGWFETLAIKGRFQVKRIFVKPSAALSLQSHHHRSEHWIVVEGTAKVTVGEDTRLVTEGQSIYIPLGEKHRLENPGKVPTVLIEVQTGAYLGEDDIVRYEDLYARS